MSKNAFQTDSFYVYITLKECKTTTSNKIGQGVQNDEKSILVHGRTYCFCIYNYLCRIIIF